MAKLEIPVRVYMGELEEIINELKHLQTYKLFEGDDTVLIDCDEVVKIFADHLRAEVLSDSTIDPEQKWVPCSETINIPDHEVLCCDKYGEELIGWLSYNDDQWLCVSEGEMMYDPIAWREKPDPYAERKMQ